MDVCSPGTQLSYVQADGHLAIVEDGLATHGHGIALVLNRTDTK